MTDDDPFGLKDFERTQIVRPQPGGRSPSAPPRLQAAPPAGTGAPLPEGTAGRGPLVQAAFSLLAVAPQLRARTPPMDPASLQARVQAELAQFEDRAHRLGADSRQVRTGHYVLCALIDDIVLNTPWGAHGIWKSQTLAGTLHHDVDAGQRFFEVLDQARRTPERHRPLLELLAACMAMGFEGQFRLLSGGAAEIARLREDLLRQLAGLDGPLPEELSPQWQGIAARHEALGELIPLWVAAVATLTVLALLYVGFVLRLGGYAERLGALVTSLPPAAPVELIRATPAEAAPPRVVATVAPRLTACLRAAGLPESGVSEDLQRVRVRLPNAGLFASGRADLEPGLVPLLRCVAGELREEPGRVLVVGHTDNVPIRTSRFPTNWDLSKARAAAVRTVLAEVIPEQGRLTVEGRADAQPIASNADAAGRARNRRVEILLLK
jgi:type VI secretion system protein ImpK